MMDFVQKKTKCNPAAAVTADSCFAVKEFPSASHLHGSQKEKKHALHLNVYSGSLAVATVLSFGLLVSKGNKKRYTRFEAHHREHTEEKTVMSLYPEIKKPAAILHWLNHANIDAEFVLILDADTILRGPITPCEVNSTPGRPVSTPYDYPIGCDNVLAKLHTRHPDACDEIGGLIIIHIDDLRRFAMLWLHKTEEVRADIARYATNTTGAKYESGWISET